MLYGHQAGTIVRLRRSLATLFDDNARQNRATRYFNAALAFLIIVSVGAVILESVEPIRARHPRLFIYIEHIATAIFVLEYALRVWTAVDLHKGPVPHPLRDRLRYITSFFGLIDLISILPAALGLLGAGDFRVLRLVRLLRMLKLTRHSTVFAMIWNVLREEAHAIGALVFILFLTVTISGALMYMIEGEEQATLFTSIPVCMWWAIETLTTVGYGDMIPATAAGRILGGAVIIVGIVTLALFSGLITVSFIDQLRLRRDRPNVKTTSTEIEIVQIDAGGATCPHCGGTLRHGEV
ncbi:ion transporter [Methyloferula stellata]|uniref:ion transporter n=1 Tax=Methyloferula stellata TaxID=876270 RepID=UPI00037772A3|nr:ion transporter [Methyloferula stellata]